MTALQEKITKAKVKLILNQPFFATIMLSMAFRETTEAEAAEVKTAATDGKEIIFNPAFVETLSLDELQGLIAHEVCHVAYCHHTRQGEREGKRWNQAADYAINPILIDSGFTLPPDGLVSNSYRDKSAEEIYTMLPPEQPGSGNGQQQQQPGGKGGANDPGNCGAVKKAPARTAAQLREIEAETKQLVSQAAMIAKQQGKLPAHLKRFVDELLTPVVNWHEVLSSFLTDIARNDYTFRKPSPRYIASGLYLPSLENVERGKFALMVDTSGSIDRKQLNEFAAEIQSILSDSANELTVMFIDAALQHVQEFATDDEMNLQPKGGGGTDFKPGFEYIDKEGIETAAVIYFTDGYCNSFPADPGYSVLWAVWGDNKGFSPPFGEVIHV